MDSEGRRGIDPEAHAILQEIKSILADETLGGRTIGVVTLLGTDQAAHIHKLVTTQISPVDVVNRRIAVGPPPVFQGRERDIMLVSMVLAPGDHSAHNRAGIRTNASMWPFPEPETGISLPIGGLHSLCRGHIERAANAPF